MLPGQNEKINVFAQSCLLESFLFVKLIVLCLFQTYVGGLKKKKRHLHNKEK